MLPQDILPILFNFSVAALPVVGGSSISLLKVFTIHLSTLMSNSQVSHQFKLDHLTIETN